MLGAGNGTENRQMICVVMMVSVDIEEEKKFERGNKGYRWCLQYFIS